MKVAVLGLILLGAAAVLTAAVVTSNTGAVETDLWGATVSDVSIGIVFVAGMITTVVAVAGLALVMASVRRGQRLRQERRSLRRENQRLSQRVRTPVAPFDEAPADAGHDTVAPQDTDRTMVDMRAPEPEPERTGRTGWLGRNSRSHDAPTGGRPSETVDPPVDTRRPVEPAPDAERVHRPVVAQTEDPRPDSTPAGSTRTDSGRP